MAMQEFTVEAMKDFDNGKIAVAFEQALRRCVDDCDDRPNVKKARVITLQMAIIPIADEAGLLDEIKAQFVVKDTAPKRESKVYSFAYRKGGKLASNDLSPTDVKTRTFDELEGGGGFRDH